jgi:hypothetical protein
MMAAAVRIVDEARNKKLCKFIRRKDEEIPY